MADSISAIPQQPQLGRLAQFLRFLETQNAPEFLPKQLDVMGLMAKLALPQASTVENLSYGNYPFTMPPAGTGAAIPQVKTGRKPEVADLVGMLGGVPGVGAVSDVATKLSNEAADAIVRAITRNPEATATGVIRETSMPFMQAVAPRTPGLLETPAKSELGFYSALEQATMPLQNKGTGAQFLAQIEKTAGVKPEEVKWTGLDEFLKSRQNVTKQEVQDYLAANRVNLQEVRLGGATSPYPYRTADEWQGAINRAEAAGNWDEAANLNQAWEAVEGFGPAGSPKFSQYTLPGGENYREILLTLPQKVEKGFMTPNGAFFSEADLADPIVRSTAEKIGLSPAFRNVGDAYRSSHFDQPNILAHMRVNDRVVDGKKTLFIEEIQSDWHQAGRKKGYQQDLTPAEREEMQVLMQRELREQGFGGEDAIRLQELLNKPYASSIPNAPFKTTWHELTLKRAIQEASEKGYDQIAFTTGKTQAERYDLSKQVDYIDYVKEGPDQFRLAIVGKNGQGIDLPKETFSTAELENYVGKEVAERIVKGEGQTGGGRTTLRGPDLQIGGEGMKGFYDQILPKTLDKLGKKFDAKVTKSKMKTSGENMLAEKLRENGYDPENVDLQQILSDHNGRTPRWLTDSDVTALELGYTPNKSQAVEVWTMDITPKMRESVITKGQPLFQFAPAAPAAGLLGGDESE